MLDERQSPTNREDTSSARRAQPSDALDAQVFQQHLHPHRSLADLFRQTVADGKWWRAPKFLPMALEVVKKNAWAFGGNAIETERIQNQLDPKNLPPNPHSALGHSWLYWPGLPAGPQEPCRQEENLQILQLLHKWVVSFPHRSISIFQMFRPPRGPNYIQAGGHSNESQPVLIPITYTCDLKREPIYDTKIQIDEPQSRAQALSEELLQLNAPAAKGLVAKNGKGWAIIEYVGAPLTTGQLSTPQHLERFIKLRNAWAQAYPDRRVITERSFAWKGPFMSLGNLKDKTKSGPQEGTCYRIYTVVYFETDEEEPSEYEPPFAYRDDESHFHPICRELLQAHKASGAEDGVASKNGQGLAVVSLIAPPHHEGELAEQEVNFEALKVLCDWSNKYPDREIQNYFLGFNGGEHFRGPTTDNPAQMLLNTQEYLVHITFYDPSMVGKGSPELPGKAHLPKALRGKFGPVPEFHNAQPELLEELSYYERDSEYYRQELNFIGYYREPLIEVAVRDKEETAVADEKEAVRLLSLSEFRAEISKLILAGHDAEAEELLQRADVRSIRLAWSEGGLPQLDETFHDRVDRVSEDQKIERIKAFVEHGERNVHLSPLTAGVNEYVERNGKIVVNPSWCLGNGITNEYGEGFCYLECEHPPIGENSETYQEMHSEWTKRVAADWMNRPENAGKKIWGPWIITSIDEQLQKGARNWRKRAFIPYFYEDRAGNRNREAFLASPEYATLLYHKAVYGAAVPEYRPANGEFARLSQALRVLNQPAYEGIPDDSAHPDQAGWALEELLGTPIGEPEGNRRRSVWESLKMNAKWLEEHPGRRIDKMEWGHAWLANFTLPWSEQEATSGSSPHRPDESMDHLLLVRWTGRDPAKFGSMVDPQQVQELGTMMRTEIAAKLERIKADPHALRQLLVYGPVALDLFPDAGRVQELVRKISNQTTS